MALNILSVCELDLHFGAIKRDLQKKKKQKRQKGKAKNKTNKKKNKTIEEQKQGRGT